MSPQKPGTSAEIEQKTDVKIQLKNWGISGNDAESGGVQLKSSCCRLKMSELWQKMSEFWLHMPDFLLKMAEYCHGEP